MLKRTFSGTSSTYVEGVDKVTGKCQYTFDVTLPNMLVGKFLYPEYPHARIKRLDTSAAESLPGVAAVATHRDLRGEKYYGYLVKDQPAFAIDEVCFVGDIVAAVAAEDEDTAGQALQAIEVEYEPLPGIFDPRLALQPGAALARGNLENNILYHHSIVHGDADRGFAEADLVVEHTYHTGGIQQLSMETIGALAAWDGEALTVIAGGQHPHRDRIQIAEQLGLPANRVRIVYPFVGGGFGEKDELHVQVQVAALALKAGRPVKVVRTRSEAMFTHVKRHQSFVRYKTGVRADGRLVAIEAEAIFDAGPYTNASLAIVGFGCEMASGCYNVPNARIDGYAVATNNLAGGAMRGFGGPEMAFAQEQNLDIVAERLGLDPLELRLKNAHEKGVVTTMGFVLPYEVGLKQTMEAAGQAAEWFNREAWLERQPAPHQRRGLGVASIWHGLGQGARNRDYSRATLEMAPDGSVVLGSGTAEIGAGSRTAQVMIAADALGVRPEDIRLPAIDTDLVPDAGPTTASRSTFMMGNALLQAAEPIRRSLLTVAAEELEAAPEDLMLAEGVIRVRGGPPDRQVTVGAAARKAWNANLPLRGEGHAVRETLVKEGVLGIPGGGAVVSDEQMPFTVYQYATHIAQVLVDTETGSLRVEKYWAAHDVGRAINRLGVEGQIHGGVVQGLGTALMEEIHLDDGRLTNPTLESYLVPTVTEMPELHSIIVECPVPGGPFGAVGVGESTINAVAAAIANAVADAIGVHLWEIPMTPERVLQALEPA